MKILAIAAIALCAAALAATQFASSKPAAGAPSGGSAVELVQGTIQSVSEPNMSFVLSNTEGQLTIRVDEHTTYTLDGRSTTRSEALRIGAAARVDHKERLATSVAVTSPKAFAPEELTGTIGSVDAKGASFTLVTAAGELSIQVDNDTVFTLDGRDSTRAEALRRGAHARVSRRDLIARRVEVTTTEPPK